MAPHAVLSGNRHALMLVERLQTIPAFGHGGPTHKRGPRKERGRAGFRAGWRVGRTGARTYQLGKELRTGRHRHQRQHKAHMVHNRLAACTAERVGAAQVWQSARWTNHRVFRERDSSLCHFCSRPELRLDLLSREEWEGKEGEVRGRPAASALDNAPGARAYACPRAAMRRTRPMTWAPTLFSLAFGFDVCVGCLYQFLFLCPWKAIKWRLP